MRGSAAFRVAVAPGGALAGPWVQNSLWTAARAVPSLDLRFADNKSLVDAVTGAQLVTFTRASSGTFVGSDGVLRSAVTNLLLRSEEFNDASWTKTNSTITANTVVSPDGLMTGDSITSSAGLLGHVVQNVSQTTGTAYTFSAFAKANQYTFCQLRITGAVVGAITRAYFNLAAGTVAVATNCTASIAPVGNDWYRCSITYTTISTATASPRVYGQVDTADTVGDGTSGIYIWGAQMEQSSTVGEYIPTTSTINSAPRFDHNPTTGESLGLLVEEARTNLFLQSNQFDTTWTNTNSSETAASGTAPDGTNTAWELKDTLDVILTSHQVNQTITFTSGVTYTFTCWFKAGTLTQGGFVLPAAAFTTAINCRINLLTGSVITSSATLSTSTTLFPNGWVRVTATAVATATIAGSATIRIMDGATSYIGTGNGTILIWGAQLEAGAFPTSYIPTTTATVTRAADVASITGTNFSSWANNNEGTIFSDSSIIASQIKTQAVWELSGGTVLSSLRQPHATANQFRAVIGGTFTAGTGANLTTGVTLAAVAYSGTQGRLQVGSLGANATGSALDATSLSIGNLTGGSQLNGRIKRICFWPSRLPDSPLETITQ